MLRKTLLVIGATMLLAACSSKKDDANANANDSIAVVEEAVEVVTIDTIANDSVAPATAPAGAQNAATATVDSAAQK